MAAKRRIKSVWLQSWGSAIGLNFERGGTVEVLMTWPEVRRILDAWKEYEGMKKKPETKVLDALIFLQRRVSHLPGEIIAEVPIAQGHALIIPVIPDASVDSNSMRQHLRTLRQRMLGLSIKGNSRR